jgi:DNA-binding transcriptional regulator YdaS (Cro superfamily)
VNVLAALVQQACSKHRLRTKVELAALLGVTPQRLNDWEAGSRRCPDARLATLARLAGVKPAAVIGSYGVEWLEKKGENDGD